MFRWMRLGLADSRRFACSFALLWDRRRRLKALLRTLAARTVPRLWDALGDLLGRFTPQECANYAAEAGYVPSNRNLL
jgi:hypothetical protein